MLVIVTELIQTPLIFAPFAAATSDEGTKLHDFPSYPKPAHLGVPVLANIPLQINVLFLGVPTEIVDTAKIQTLLSPWYTQINRERYMHRQELEMYVNFTLSYKFIFVSSSIADAYSQFIISQHTEDTPPPWLSSLTTTAWYVNAYGAETWLKNNLPIPVEGYTLILIDTSHNTLPITQYYFYDGTQIDPDTGKTPKAFTSTYMIGYGGDAPNRFLFLDLSAGPTCYHRPRTCPSDADVNKIDTYNLTNPTDIMSFDSDLARYVQSAIDLRFVPSYLYRPIFRDSFYLNVTIFSGDPALRYSDYINMTHIINVFSGFLPLSNFTGGVYEVPIEKDPGLYATVQSALDPDGRLEASPVNSYFLSNYRRYVSSLGATRVIPIFILAGYRFSQFFGEAVPSQNGNFGFVLEGIDQDLIGRGLGLTYVTLHEASHAFGIPHPHDGFDWAQREFTFWAYDYSASITTYAIDNIFPDQMNYDQRDMGSAAILLNQTYANLQATDSTLARLGYTQTPALIADFAKIALNYSTTAISLISQPNPNYENASINARVALIAAQSAYTTAIKLPQTTISITTLTRESSTIAPSVSQAQTQSASLTTSNSTGSVDYIALVAAIVFIVSVTIAAYGLWQRSKAKTAKS